MERVDNARPEGLFSVVENPGLGVFAKEPLPGRVKTRLCPPLDAGEAAEFYLACLDETVERMQGCSFGLTLFFDGDEVFFRNRYSGVNLVPQGDGNLGHRMERALAYLLAQGGLAALIGSDSPDLDAARVEQVFKVLESAEVATIPSLDGGYVLIAERLHHPLLFTDMPWSTADVLSQTRIRVADGAIPYAEIGVWEDVDDMDSLRRLIHRSPDCRAVRFARTHLAHHL